ncbi:hypothetical protein AAG570_002354, partial [Ranatra chinensis]
ITEFPAACKRLFQNKLLIINIFSGVAYILGASGYITYLSKYLEVQFNKSSAEASLVIGPITLLSVVIGFLVSGVVISKFKPTPPYLLGWNVIVGFIFIFGELLFLLITCKDKGMVGYSALDKRINLPNSCNLECGCENLKYSPVCLEAYGMTFYSPCHAGCSGMTNEEGVMRFINQICMLQFYHNCTCVPNSNGLPPFETYSGALKGGPCPFECGNNFELFITVMFIIHCFGSSGKIGNILVNYRSVDPEDKSFAQGISLLFISLVAFIPGPIMYGWLIDSTCLVWDESCGSRGNCWYYDKEDFRLKLNATAAGITVFGVILDIIVCYLGRNLDLYGEDEENEGTNDRLKYKVDSETEEGPLKFAYLPNREA